jgi:hypothetical protein
MPKWSVSRRNTGGALIHRSGPIGFTEFGAQAEDFPEVRIPTHRTDNAGEPIRRLCNSLKLVLDLRNLHFQGCQAIVCAGRLRHTEPRVSPTTFRFDAARRSYSPRQRPGQDPSHSRPELPCRRLATANRKTLVRRVLCLDPDFPDESPCANCHSPTDTTGAHPLIVEARRRWVGVGWHPAAEDL